MGLPLRCFLGFSTAYSNGFTERLERRSVELDRRYRNANADLMEGLNALHDAVDASLAGDATSTRSAINVAIGLLDSCRDHLCAIEQALAYTCSDLSERARLDATDPLVARDRCFALLDGNALYGTLASSEAVLPHGVYWDELVTRVRGGAAGGLRLLADYARELARDVQSFCNQVEQSRTLPVGEIARVLHGCSLPIALLIMRFTRLITTFTYFSILCEQATQIYENGAEHREIFARAS